MIPISHDPHNTPDSPASADASGRTRPAWMSDELVRDIPARKLDFLAELFGQAHSGDPNEKPSQKALLLRLLPKLKQARAEHLELTPAELQAAIAAIRKHSTAQEQQRMDEILAKTVQ